MNNRLRSVFLVLFVAVILGAVAMPAFADPPGRTARLSFMEGSVSFQPGGVDDWVTASLNRPLTTSDRVWTDKASLAELTMGNVVVRMGNEASVTFTNLDDNTAQVELDQGQLYVHVRRLHDNENIEVDTPNLAFTVNQPGDYRLYVDPNGDTTEITVREGDGTATGQGPSMELAAGQRVVFSNGQSMTAQTVEMAGMDDFERWNLERNRRYDHPRSVQYVSDDMVGYEDLDDHGDWAQDAQYGPIWRPRVAVGWAPYHTGHWAWIDPWGYTWVDDAPWGFAPFHYGRWVYAGGGWGWCPGPRPVVTVGVAYVRPVYAPALVAFVGGGGISVGISIGGGGGAVGWVPLGFGEPYYPSYHVSENYVRNVNVTNTHITNITNVTNNYTVINNNNTTVINNVHYANQAVPGAVTAVPANAMASGKPVAQAAVKVDPKEMANAKFSAAPGVAPSKEAVLGGKAPTQAHTPPPAALQRQVVAKTPPPPPPVKFEAKQQLLQKNGGRPLEAAQVKSLPTVQRAAPKVVAAPAGKPQPAPPVGKSTGPANAKPGAPANAGKPGAPANEPKPGTPATAGKPGTPEPAKPGTPAAGKPIPANTPAPKPNTPPAKTANEPARPNEPKTNAEPGRVNEPKTSAEPARPNQPGTPGAKPVPHPPTAESTPAKPANAAHPPAAETNRPPAAQQNVPRPPERQAAPAHNPPPKENKQPPAKNEKEKKNNDEKPK